MKPKLEPPPIHTCLAPRRKAEGQRLNAKGEISSADDIRRFAERHYGPRPIEDEASGIEELNVRAQREKRVRLVEAITIAAAVFVMLFLVDFCVRLLLAALTR